MEGKYTPGTTKEIALLDGVSVFVSPEDYAAFVIGAISLPKIINDYCSCPTKAY